MSREIKFRLYSKPAKMYIDYITIGFLNTGRLRSYSTENGVGPVLEDSYIVEQYTGLLDRNGKEICEGDIVRFYEVYCAVVWDEDRACFDLETGQNRGAFVFNKTSLAKMEIIGNIHEPPKVFRPEHLKRMGVSISKGGEV